jgi:predicted transcriptional regulator
MFINIYDTVSDGLKEMNEKLRESVQYLKQCTNIENETFKLYETLSKKINQPESSFILGIAYDCQKNAKIIQGILDCLDLPELENKNARKELSELAADVMILEKKISRISNLEYLTTCEMLKKSTNLEVLLTKVYTNYLEANSARTIVDELSKTGIVSLDNFKKVFEYFIEEKGKHRQTIVETMYVLEAKETETHRQITPVVKYQNPDQWIHESTIHSFSNTPVIASSET